MSESLLQKIALSMIDHAGPKTVRNLVSYCGSIEGVFKENKAALRKVPQLNKKVIDVLSSGRALALAEQELKIIDKKGVKVVDYLDPLYPQRLKHYEDSPILLYYKGDINKINQERTVAIVGTRTPSDYGRAICDKLVSELQDYQAIVVSGLAYGIDTQAHRKAVNTDLTTFGVMGNGFHKTYPSDNRRLAEQMLEKGGLISEFSFFTKPNRENFPMRNRIIAGLSDAVIVVESKSKGGSIITADLANDYHKDVFAVPGRLGDDISEGCNNLIKQNRAHLIQSAKDLAYIMRWDQKEANLSRQKSLFLELSEQEQKITALLKEKKPVHLDHLVINTPYTLAQVSTSLLELEFKGLIRSIPGKRYSLT